jgi:acyl carrier protein
MTNQERIYQTLIEVLGVDEAEITPDALIRDDLGADSLDGVKLAMSLEEEFDILIDDDDADRFVRVRDIVWFINRRVAEPTAVDLEAE